jgi:hypothetical protein
MPGQPPRIKRRGTAATFNTALIAGHLVNTREIGSYYAILF